MSTKRVSPGVTRFEIPGGAHGFLVRITRQGEAYRKFFADSKNSGKRGAKKAAQAYYEELVETLPEPTQSTDKMTARNSTGVVGVHFSHDSDARWGGDYYSYTASWVEECGQRRNVKFAWKKYGELDAWRLACLARQDRERDRAKLQKTLARVKKRKKSPIPETPSTAEIRRAKKRFEKAMKKTKSR